MLEILFYTYLVNTVRNATSSNSVTRTKRQTVTYKAKQLATTSCKLGHSDWCCNISVPKSTRKQYEFVSSIRLNFARLAFDVRPELQLHKITDHFASELIAMYHVIGA